MIDINKAKPNKPHYKGTTYSGHDGTVQFSMNLSFEWCVFRCMYVTFPINVGTY